jgi:hypothetical protein
MPKICYKRKRFHQETNITIKMANIIINEYLQQGYSLTLRQLYYQFVARDIIKNSQKEYDRLGKIINDARLAGLIDWDAIVDRTRNMQMLSFWDSPAEILHSASKSFRLDIWSSQSIYVECWIEKEALVGVIERVCNKWRIPFFACRGYVSQSEQWRAANRIKGIGKHSIIFHLGDHDPSGIDMTRDIEDRFRLFGCNNVEIVRLALNMDQVEKYNPPPNPAKMTDTRSNHYVDEYGYDSWELDALNPEIINDLIESNVKPFIDFKRWDDMLIQEGEHKEKLMELSNEF